MPSIDLAFRLTGSIVPVDHGYTLYAALSRILPELHAAKDIGVQPIRGVYSGNGTLHLADFSRLILRLPDEQIQAYLKLAGKKLAVDDHPLSVGVPEVRTLRPVVRLRARLVTIKGLSPGRRISRRRQAPTRTAWRPRSGPYRHPPHVSGEGQAGRWF